MSPLPLRQMIVLAGLSAVLIAATQVSLPSGWSLPGLYAYWLLRIAIEAAIIIAGLQLAALGCAPGVKRVIAAFAVSIVTLGPFVLAITALDIVLGLPELEQLSISAAQTSDPSPLGERLTVFLLEMLYLLDNHLTLTAILALPWYARTSGDQDRPNAVQPSAPSSSPADIQQSEGDLTQAASASILSLLDPPFEDTLVRAEAQEHYVRLVGETETRMVLYRFNDLIRQLPADAGLRVHRSHWVATCAVEHLYREGSNLRLMLKNGTSVPVSRRNARTAEAIFEFIPEPLASGAAPSRN